MRGTICCGDIHSNFIHVLCADHLNVDIWEIITGLKIRTLASHSEVIEFAKFINCPATSVLYVTSAGYVCELDTEGNCKKFLNFYTTHSNVLSFTHNGKLVTAGIDGTLAFHDFNRGTVRHMFAYYGFSQFTKLLERPDGNLIVYNKKGQLCLKADDVIPDEANNIDAHVMSCGILQGQDDEFFTLDNQGILKIWSTTTLEKKRSVEVQEWDHHSNSCRGAIAHPTRNLILLFSKDLWRVIDSRSLQTCSSYEVTVGPDGGSGHITDMFTSSDGSTCVVIIGNQGMCLLFGISAKNKVKKLLDGNGDQVSYKMRGEIKSCDLSTDNDLAVCGGESGIYFWNVITGVEEETGFRSHATDVKYVKFLYKPYKSVLYMTEDNRVNIADVFGKHIRTLSSAEPSSVPQALQCAHNPYLLVTTEQNGSLAFHNVLTGRLEHIFKDEQFVRFTQLLEFPQKNTLLAYNSKGATYILKPSQVTVDIGKNFVVRAGVFAGGEKLFTLSCKGVLEIWDVLTMERIRSKNICGWEMNYGGATANMENTSVIVFTKKSLLIQNAVSLQVTATLTLEVQNEGDDEPVIIDVVISGNGEICVAITGNEVRAFDISNTNFIKELASYKVDGRINCCDIYEDNLQVVLGGKKGIDVWNIETGEVRKRLVEVESHFVKYINISKGSILHDHVVQFEDRSYSSRVSTISKTGIRNISSIELRRPLKKKAPLSSLLLVQKESILITTSEDNCPLMYDIVSGDLLFSFKESSSWSSSVWKMAGRFTSIVEVPSLNKVLLYSTNGISYDLNMITLGEVVFHQDDYIISSGLLPGETEFFTLSQKGALEVWSTTSLDKVRSACVYGWNNSYGGAVAHPSRKLIIVFAERCLFVFDAVSMKTVSKNTVCIDGVLKPEVTDVVISPDGNKCIVIVGKQGTALVCDMSHTNESKESLLEALFGSTEQVSYEMKGEINSCDINRDNKTVVTGGDEGIHLWRIRNGTKISCYISASTPTLVKFMYHTVQSVYHSGKPWCCMVADTVHGEFVFALLADGSTDSFNVFEGKKRGRGFKRTMYKLKLTHPISPRPFSLIANNRILVTAEEEGALRFYDVKKSRLLETFVNPACKRYISVLEIPKRNIVLVYDENGMTYVIKPPQPVAKNQPSLGTPAATRTQGVPPAPPSRIGFYGVTPPPPPSSGPPPPPSFPTHPPPLPLPPRRLLPPPPPPGFFTSFLPSHLLAPSLQPIPTTRPTPARPDTESTDTSNVPPSLEHSTQIVKEGELDGDKITLSSAKLSDPHFSTALKKKRSRKSGNRGGPRRKHQAPRSSDTDNWCLESGISSNQDSSRSKIASSIAAAPPVSDTISPRRYKAIVISNFGRQLNFNKNDPTYVEPKDSKGSYW